MGSSVTNRVHFPLRVTHEADNNKHVHRATGWHISGSARHVLAIIPDKQSWQTSDHWISSKLAALTHHCTPGPLSGLPTTGLKPPTLETPRQGV
jgi:hypothetical protein